MLSKLIGKIHSLQSPKRRLSRGRTMNKMWNRWPFCCAVLKIIILGNAKRFRQRQCLYIYTMASPPRVEPGSTSTAPPTCCTPCNAGCPHACNFAKQPICEIVAWGSTSGTMSLFLPSLDHFRISYCINATPVCFPDPPLLNPKGRPHTARITGPLEGRARGGARNLPMSSQAGTELLVRNN